MTRGAQFHVAPQPTAPDVDQILEFLFPPHVSPPAQPDLELGPILAISQTDSVIAVA